MWRHVPCTEFLLHHACNYTLRGSWVSVKLPPFPAGATCLYAVGTPRGLQHVYMCYAYSVHARAVPGPEMYARSGDNVRPWDSQPPPRQQPRRPGGRYSRRY